MRVWVCRLIATFGTKDSQGSEITFFAALDFEDVERYDYQLQIIDFVQQTCQFEALLCFFSVLATCANNQVSVGRTIFIYLNAPTRNYRQ